MCKSEKQKKAKNSDQPPKEKTYAQITDVPEQHLRLMEVYLSEWQHRDSFLWTQTVHLFYATLIVIILPNAAQGLGIIVPSISCWIFPVVGFCMSIGFLYISIGLTFRLNAIGKTYQELINKLPEKYQRISVEKMKCGKLFNYPISIVLDVVLFVGLAVLALFLFFYYI